MFTGPVRVLSGAVSAALLFAAVPAVADQSAGWRTLEAERLLVIDTTKGRIYVEMNPDIAPRHVEHIRSLAGSGFYDNVKWHRVIDRFMAQTGDPSGTGLEGSSLPDLEAEFTFRRLPDSTFKGVATPMGAHIGVMDTVPVVSQSDYYMTRSDDGGVMAWGTYCPGVAGMARDTPENSANAQFFLMRSAYPSLDKRYTIWGRVVVGQNVVDSMKDGALPSGVVEDPDMMIRARAADQMAESDRPVIMVRDTRSAVFESEVAQVRQERGADFSVCDIPIATHVVKP